MVSALFDSDYLNDMEWKQMSIFSVPLDGGVGWGPLPDCLGSKEELWCPVRIPGFLRERIKSSGEILGSRTNDKGGWHPLGYWEFSANSGTTWAGILEPNADNKDKRCFKGWMLFPLSPGQNLVPTFILIKAVVFCLHWSSKGTFLVCSLCFLTYGCTWGCLWEVVGA